MGDVLNRLRLELQEALRAEGEAAGRLRELRRRVASVIARAVAAGVPYDLLAITTLRARLGRAPTIPERIREAHRLRKRSSRFLVTDGHANHLGQGLGSDPPGVACSERKEAQNMATKLVKKTTTTIEEFAGDGLHGAEADLGDADEEDEEDEDADEAPEKAPAASRRPRR
jgi:hypothetical protein